MKRYKRFLCVFLAVLILFFGVSNSYFSPHKMDNVEASSVALPFVISAEVLIQLACTIVISGLAVGLVVEWTDMDFEAVIDDMHDWLRDNIEILDSINIDGTSALKEWAEADTWVVVEGGGGSAPNPSPSPGKIIDFPSKWTINSAISSGVIALQDFVNKTVPAEEGYFDLAEAYINDKISKFKTSPTPVLGLDPITDALQYRYGTDEQNQFTDYYSGIPKADEDGYLHYSSCFRESNENGYWAQYDRDIKINPDERFGAYINEDYLYFNKSVSIFTTMIDSNGGDVSSSGKNNRINYHIGESSNGFWKYAFGASFPIFQTKEALDNYITTGDDSECINRKPKHNYIDTDDDYGWASTADLSPSDLAALGLPIVPTLINGRDVSIAALAEAVNALKSQLEDLNPNIDPSGNPVSNPVPYPDVPTYTDIWKDVIGNPDIFPETSPSTNPDGGDNENPSPTAKPTTSPEEGNNTNKNKWVVDLSKFFPFCIPFDLIHLLDVLDAEPVAPRWELPFKAPAFGIDYTFVIDLKDFESLAEIFRHCETMLFILGLILLTRNIIKG